MKGITKKQSGKTVERSKNLAPEIVKKMMEDENIFTVTSLDDEQKKKILDYWNECPRPMINEVIKLLYPGAQIDARSKIGKLIREYLAEIGLDYQKARREKTEDLPLSDTERDYIKNHIGELRSIDIARKFWPHNNVSPLGKEVRTINNYIKELNAEGFTTHVVVSTPVSEEYQPPTTLTGLMRKVNEYLSMNITFEKMTPYEKNCLAKLLGFMRAPRFVAQCNTYQTAEKRKAFEAEFVRGCYEKPDLTPDQINQYVNLCSDYVLMTDSLKTIEKLNIRLDNLADDPDGKISMGLTEAISVAKKEYNELIVRQGKIISDLDVKRSARNKDKTISNASIANLVEFVRDNENRKTLERIHNLNQQLLKNETDRIAGLEDVIALVMGVDVSDILN